MKIIKTAKYKEARKTSYKCNSCQNVFQAADDGQLHRCPNCNSRDNRHTTAIEDMHSRRDSINT
jgi:rRNA maturation endonuclease Nob1